MFATDGEKLVGIAPFRKTRKRLAGNFGYTIIEPVTNGNTDYTGIILAEQETCCINEFLAYLFKQKDWDLLSLPDLPQASRTIELIKNTHTRLPGFSIKKGWLCPYMAIPDSKEKLMENLNSKFRRELQRRLRKLERERGRVEFKHHYELGSFEETMSILFNLHRKRWQSKGEPGGYTGQKERNIVMQTSKFFAQKGWLELHFLTVNSKPVAAELDVEYGGKLYGQISGFDPAYSKYSLGNILFLKILEECVEKGISEYDFMQGAETYKFEWTNQTRQNTNIQFVNKKLYSKLVGLTLKVLDMLELSIQNAFPNAKIATFYNTVNRRLSKRL